MARKKCDYAAFIDRLEHFIKRLICLVWLLHLLLFSKKVEKPEERWKRPLRCSQSASG